MNGERLKRIMKAAGSDARGFCLVTPFLSLA